MHSSFFPKKERGTRILLKNSQHHKDGIAYNVHAISVYMYVHCQKIYSLFVRILEISRKASL